MFIVGVTQDKPFPFDKKFNCGDFNLLNFIDEEHYPQLNYE